MSKEAMKLALEALKIAEKHMGYVEFIDAIEALEEALKKEHGESLYQPAVLEAVELLKSLGYVYQQTPKGLAWVNQQNNENLVAGYFYTNDNGCYIECDPKHKGEKGVVPLYTKP